MEKKNLYIAYHLLKKLIFSNKQEKKIIIKTWSRSSTISFLMVGYTISIYNGKTHIPIYITESLIGHKLGEFVFTRKFQFHKNKNEFKNAFRKPSKKSLKKKL